MLKATVGSLLIILVVVITLSYHINKEAFVNIPAASTTATATDPAKVAAQVNATKKVQAETTRLAELASTTAVPNPQANNMLKALGKAPAGVSPTDPVTTCLSAPLSTIATIAPPGIISSEAKTAAGTSPVTACLSGPFAAVEKPLAAAGAFAPPGTVVTDSRTASNKAPSVSITKGHGEMMEEKGLSEDLLKSSPLGANSVYHPVIGNESNKAPTQGTIPHLTPTKPEIAVTDVSYDAMKLNQKSNLMKDIQKIVRNELISSHILDPNVQNDSSKASTHQNSRMEKATSCMDNMDTTDDNDQQYAKYKGQRIDMSKYIKKNEIPCWGCSLDY